MRKVLSIILALCLCCAFALAEQPAADADSIARFAIPDDWTGGYSEKYSCAEYTAPDGTALLVDTMGGMTFESTYEMLNSDSSVYALGSKELNGVTWITCRRFDDDGYWYVGFTVLEDGTLIGAAFISAVYYDDPSFATDIMGTMVTGELPEVEEEIPVVEEEAPAVIEEEVPVVEEEAPVDYGSWDMEKTVYEFDGVRYAGQEYTDSYSRFTLTIPADWTVSYSDMYRCNIAENGSGNIMVVHYSNGTSLDDFITLADANPNMRNTTPVTINGTRWLLCDYTAGATWFYAFTEINENMLVGIAITTDDMNSNAPQMIEILSTITVL